MSAESDFIESLRALATHPAARGLADDAAVLEIAGRTLVLTHDMLVEGVHYLPDDPPEDVAWKLVAVNLSDLAAKGARPLGVLLGYSIGEEDWDRGFLAGLGLARDRRRRGGAADREGRACRSRRPGRALPAAAASAGRGAAAGASRVGD